MDKLKLLFGKIGSMTEEPVNRNHYIIRYLREHRHKNNGILYYENIKAMDLKPGYLVTDPEHFLKLFSSNTQLKKEDTKKYAVPIYELFPDKEQFRKQAQWNLYNICKNGSSGGKSHLEQIPDDSYYQDWELKFLKAQVDWQLHYYTKMEEFYKLDYPEKLFEPQTKKEYESLTDYDPNLSDIIDKEELYPYGMRGTHIGHYSSRSGYYFKKLDEKQMYDHKPVPSMSIFNCQQIETLPDGVYPLITQVRITPNQEYVKFFDFKLAYVYHGVLYLHEYAHEPGFGSYRKSPKCHVEYFLNQNKKM